MSHWDSNDKTETESTEMSLAFKTAKSTPVTHLFQQDQTSCMNDKPHNPTKIFPPTEN